MAQGTFPPGGPTTKPVPKEPPKAVLPGTAAPVAVHYVIRGKGRIRSTGAVVCDSETGKHLPSEGGVSCNGVAMAAGTMLRLTAEPRSGWRFKGWESQQGLCAGVKQSACLAPARQALLVAVFEVDPGGSGAITIGKSTVSVHIPNAGGKVATAPFAPATIACTNASGKATGSCVVGVPKGGTIELTATPDGTHTFLGWSGTGLPASCQGSNPKCVLAPTAPATTVTAMFGPLEATLAISEAPKAMSLSTGAPSKLVGISNEPRLFKGQLVRKGGPGIEGESVELKLGDYGSCTAKTTINGAFACSILPKASPAEAAKRVGGNVIPEARLIATGKPVPITGMKAILIVDQDGYTRDTLSALIVEAALKKAMPGGILLHNYTRNDLREEPERKHLAMASRIYLTKELSETDAIKFDLPFMGSKPYFYFANNMLVRFGAPSVKGPANVTVGVSMSGHNGSGPALFGFCYATETLDKPKCWAGADGAAPDLTGITLSGQIELKLVVNLDGRVGITLASSTVKIDFDCGGLLSAVCGDVRDAMNYGLSKRIKDFVVNDILTSKVRVAFAQIVAERGKISTLKAVEIDGGGNLIMRGTPKLAH
ncbi:MAG TPA: hypothetical protein PK264_01400 [Hyphomicrobiaceae bacterium]|nr:hypothetical protein [Hyphomicrobiaceae bacterium]